MFKAVQKLAAQNDRIIPFYHSTNELAHIKNILQSQIPLVSIKNINKLRQLIARASLGEYFLIQSGDCAESFHECDKKTTQAKLDFITQLATFFHKKTGTEVIQVGRIAGQYAKPRSNPYEFSQNERIYSYFGDMVNQSHKKHRTPDPWRMLLSYNCSASIYREMSQWNRGIAPQQKIYTSHEAFLLYYEQALTRQDDRTGLYYNLSTHFPWLGKRTVSSTQHISYLKKIANPIAVKIGPDTSIKSLIKTINELDPNCLPGRITLIPRLGAQQVHRLLPQLIDAIKRTKHAVLWSCDPMHGNTETLSTGMKTRKLSNIVEEIKSSFLIHRKMGSQLNAIHLEATHQDVTECLDYESSLCNCKKNYTSLVDPRLNYAQTMHVIQCVAKYFAER
ncbi:3-deoxy-7-phosphoheptulonate synthase [Fluoribacter gormanii]|uniref:3-deoxy-7-phosphoheptulonate synthase n=1 Tax=Fluoribacter gormanii TaxID=464 RepID=UPI0010410C0D|nr:3-deoxy-7-phosphoheptulonate synthase [Fluoribacter gormanii]